MKWGGKKPAPSSPASIITRVLPVSWLSKFKRKGGNSETSSAKNCKRSGRYFPSNASVPGGWKEGRFYSMDEEDAYWRLSFSQEKFQARRSTGGINPLWYDYDHEFGVPISSFKGLSLRGTDVPRREECRSYDDMVSDIKKMKQREGKLKTTHDGAFRSKHTTGETEFTATRQKGQNPRKLIRRISREKQAELERVADNGEHMLSNSWERDVFPIEPEEMIPMKKDAWKLAMSNSRKQFQIPNSHLSSAKEEPLIGEGSSATPDKNVSVSEWQDLENGKLKEIKVKPDHQSQKKSACTSRESHCRKTKQNNRVKAYSPRTECKVRALKEMKRSRMKWKKRVPQGQVEGKSVFDSFAVVKSSFNPQQDFRDSMVEMIREKALDRPEDLEELLACYLTLNRDEYHDLIIKVFRQVWLELNEDSIDPQIYKGQYSVY